MRSAKNKFSQCPYSDSLNLNAFLLIAPLKPDGDSGVPNTADIFVSKDYGISKNWELVLKNISIV